MADLSTKGVLETIRIYEQIMEQTALSDITIQVLKRRKMIEECNIQLSQPGPSEHQTIRPQQKTMSLQSTEIDTLGKKEFKSESI